MPGPLSSNGDARHRLLRRIDLRADCTTIDRARSRLFVHASTALRSRLLNAWRSRTSSPSSVPNSPRTVTPPPIVRASARTSSAARSQMAFRSTRESVSCAGRAKFRKLVTTSVPERLGLSARIPSTYGRYVSGQRLQIEQLAVAVDRCQTVSEFVRDAGRQFADCRQAVLEPQLFLELLHRAQIGEQTNGTMQRTVGEEWRHGNADMRRDGLADFLDLIRPAGCREGVAASSRHRHRCGARSARRSREALVDHVRAAPGSVSSRRQILGRRRPSGATLSIRRPAGFRIRTSPSSPTTSRPAVRPAMISSPSRSDASARAAVARSCAFSLLTASCSVGREERRFAAGA